MTQLRIGIVGAGTAGAASAILLVRAGHRVTVLEKVEKPGAVGAGITLQPTGQAALARLGVLDVIGKHGARIDRLTCVRRGGKPLVDLPYAEIDPRLFGLGVHRGALFETLYATARTAGAKILCGVDIVRSELRDTTRVLVDRNGGRHGPFDLVIAADGAACELHDRAQKVTSKAYPWGALWLVVPDPGIAAPGTLHQTVDGAGRMLGFLPTGRRLGGTTPLVSMFWSLRADRLDAWRAAGLPAWRDAVLRLDPRAAPILDGLEDLSPVLFSRYREVRMWPWHGDRIVFLGDAAHAMSPQLGQGTNLALVDAVTLADALAAMPTVPEALAAYSEARRLHLQFYQLATRALTPLFQSDSWLCGFVRDRTFPTSRWFGWLRRRMVRAMVGLDRGVWRPPFPIEQVVQHQLMPPSS